MIILFIRFLAFFSVGVHFVNMHFLSSFVCISERHESKFSTIHVNLLLMLFQDIVPFLTSLFLIVSNLKFEYALTFPIK